MNSPRDPQPRPGTAHAVTREAKSMGLRAVFDTNVHLHFPRLNTYDWAAEFGRGHLVVIVPMIVLEELDDRKNRGQPVIGDRAAGVLRMIEE